MQRLAERANVLIERINGKDVVLYEDHRYLVFVLWHARYIAGTITQPVNLVFFDAHCDFKQPGDEAVKKLTKLKSAARHSERRLLELVEWELSPLDDDWLKAAMELDLVADAIVIGASEGKEADEESSAYLSGNGTTHTLFTVQYLSDSLSRHGRLADWASEQQYAPLWNAIGWRPRDFPRGFEEEPGHPILLDFDCDCFAHAPLERMHAWPEEDFWRILRERSGGPYTVGWSAADFVHRLASISPFVTICRESDLCGGTKESERILSMLRTLLDDTAEF